LPYHTLGITKYAELHRPYPLDGVPVPTAESVAQVQEIFEKYFSKVTMGG
jgi:pyruvate formate lyase activating enzyme